ncbi:MAG: lipid-binding SYLF domain-containing protein [Thiobacillaceae bacterium]|jgi:lipid-binding SYLF domain-containing protein|nr:lipid-binding SYLF domain-containing protein [Thiobacillaceae bacterium]
MTRTFKQPALRYALIGLLCSPVLALAAGQAEADASAPSESAQSLCQPEPALEKQLADAEAALSRIFMGPGDEHAKLKAAAADAYAVLVFPNVAKVGFFLTAAQGKGVLSVREPDGHWSHPIVVSARVASVGPHFSMQTIDTMIVARSHEALLRLLAGGAPRQPVEAQGVAAQLVTYSSNRGLTAGLSLDNFMISVDQQANQGLYCQSILAEDLVRQGHMLTLKPPPCAQKFAQTMNRASGRAPITRQY